MPRRADSPAAKGRQAIAKTNKQLEHLSVEYVTPGEIRPNSYNPNRQNEHEFTMLCKSMEEDGFTQPIIVADDGIIVDGEHRWRAAQHIGLTQVPIVRVPMDSTQAKIATLRHNRARGSEDIELAVDVLRDLEKLGALDWAADSLDMSDDELQRLLDDIAAPEAHAGEEFTEAWTPMGNAASQEGALGPGASAHLTPAALTVARENEQRLREAKTEQEREAVRQDRRLFRLVLTFAGDEADVVKAALGNEPASRILTWCQQAS